MSSQASKPDLSFELTLWQGGVRRVAGMDEAGRGAWAGPVFAAAVALPDEPGISERLAGVRDSKQMSPRQRTVWADVIRAEAAAWGVGSADSAEIDALGILPATRLAMLRALEATLPSPQHLLLDALLLRQSDLPQTALVHGDRLSLSIAAASVLAKTSRDAWMEAWADRCPGYGFERHKGYGTRLHRDALRRLGPCSQHRLTFKPVAQAARSVKLPA